ncbi:MAG: OmpA family protein [Candidatus Schekmanbacteria bacterium]|nr:OmpA family protein [Candidatus Schekmanbacteria bacterium]
MRKIRRGLSVAALAVAVALIFSGCAAQLMGQLDADKAKLAELAKQRNDYCPEGDRLFAEVQALIEQAGHEIIDEGNQKAHAADLLAKAEAGMAASAKAYAECKPPKRYHAPKAAFSMPSEAIEGEEVMIDGSASSDEDNDPLTFAWNLGDGSSASDKMVKHAFAKGTYKVTLTVSDILYSSEPVSKEIVVKEKSLPEVIKLKEINYENVHFAFDRADLNPDAKKILDENLVAIKSHPEYSVVVIGHTDSVGTDEYNNKLSMKRAGSVKKYYEKGGIAASLIEAIGKGEKEPAADNSTKEGRAKNRRVETELHLIKK